EVATDRDRLELDVGHVLLSKFGLGDGVHELDEGAAEIAETIAEPVEVVAELLALASQPIEFYKFIEFYKCVGHSVVSIPNARTLHDPPPTEKRRPCKAMVVSARSAQRCFDF